MKKAVILAGGLGKRLMPFTQVIPKPLLPIGEKSILEIQIIHLSKYDVKEIFIATNYKSEYVESFIGNGKKWGVNIKFSKEDKPLGTCGPLSQLKNELNEPFFLINGDLLTTIDFGALYEYGKAKNCDLTVATKKIRTPFNFGSVKTNGDFIIEVEEKPDFLIEILAGIYYMKPSIFKYIPDNTYFGIDSLIKRLLAESVPIGRYLMHEYWLDIGQIDDYNKAQTTYDELFKET
jgi:NDP-sugar pyrophosphorylase family protein